MFKLHCISPEFCRREHLSVITLQFTSHSNNTLNHKNFCEEKISSTSNRNTDTREKMSHLWKFLSFSQVARSHCPLLLWQCKQIIQNIWEAWNGFNFRNCSVPHSHENFWFVAVESRAGLFFLKRSLNLLCMHFKVQCVKISCSSSKFSIHKSL